MYTILLYNFNRINSKVLSNHEAYSESKITTVTTKTYLLGTTERRICIKIDEYFCKYHHNKNVNQNEFLNR